MSLVKEQESAEAPQNGGSIIEAIQGRAQDSPKPEENAEFSADDFLAGGQGEKSGGRSENDSGSEKESETSGAAKSGGVDYKAAKKHEAEVTAETFVEFYEMGLKYLASWQFGGDPERYGFRKNDKDMCKSKGAAYFETVSFNISPGGAFAAAMAIPTMSVLAQGWEEKKAAKAAARAKWARMQAEAEAEAEALRPETMESYWEASRSGPAKIDGVTEHRNQFDIDKNGYFRKNNKGKYVEGEKPPWMKAPQWVLDITEAMKGAKQGDINKACKKKFQELLKERASEG